MTAMEVRRDKAALSSNGMDAPFLNWHRDAKAEVQANHF
jgi:hypothetical protein